MEKLDTFLFKSISYNMLLQIFFRIFSFFLNAVLLRFVSTELIGVCNFRLALLYTTVIFLAREPFRRSLPNLSNLINKWAHFKNTIWLCVPSGIFLSVICGSIWYLWLAQPNEQVVSYYQLSIFVCCLACVIELCGEVANAITQICFLGKFESFIYRK